jgi:hypothetical protein
MTNLLQTLSSKVASAIYALDLPDIGNRAVKTAIQVFAAQVAASGLGILDFVQDAAMFEKAGLAALGGAAAIVYNAVLAWASDD